MGGRQGNAPSVFPPVDSRMPAAGTARHFITRGELDPRVERRDFQCIRHRKQDGLFVDLCTAAVMSTIPDDDLVGRGDQVRKAVERQAHQQPAVDDDPFISEPDPALRLLRIEFDPAHRRRRASRESEKQFELPVPQRRPDRLFERFGFENGLLAAGIDPNRAQLAFLRRPDLFPIPTLPAKAPGRNLPRQIERPARAVSVDVATPADHGQHVEHGRPFRGRFGGP